MTWDIMELGAQLYALYVILLAFYFFLCESDCNEAS